MRGDAQLAHVPRRRSVVQSEGMTDRHAIERRVFRLALLLTGGRERAVAVLDDVLDARTHRRPADSAHLDRMTILRSRELLGPKGWRDPAALRDVPATWIDAFRAIDEQPREAWVLARLYGTPEREMARSMDCSTTATKRHLDRAESHLRDALGEHVDAFIEQLRVAVLQEDVPSVYHERRARRRRRRFVVRMTLIGLGVLLAVILAVVLLR